jgi:hypothetical protein
MAERGYMKISVVPLFKGLRLSPGETGTSAIIDLNEYVQQGVFAVSVALAAGTAGTAGTAALHCVESATRDGNYIAPSTVRIMGTYGTGRMEDISVFSPMPAPFMKVIATASGEVEDDGFDSSITADLILQ